MDEERLLTLLHSMIRGSIRMSTNVGYIGKSKPLLFCENTLRENELL